MVAEDERDQVSSSILKRLTDPAFRKLLTATTPSGEHPVIPALRSDLLGRVLSDVQASGGAGNVVVPIANGYMVIALTTPPRTVGETTTHRPIKADCTIGLLIARLIDDGCEDGEMLTYCLVGSGPKAARADLVGLAS
jgi:hypothetical protein